MGDSASEDEHEADGEIDSSCSSCVVEGQPPAKAAISRNRVVPSNKGRAHTERGKRHTDIVKKSLSSAGSVALPMMLRLSKDFDVLHSLMMMKLLKVSKPSCQAT